MSDCRYEPRTPRHEATKLVVIGLLVLAGAVYVSLEFEAQVQRVNWAIVTGVCGAAFLLYLFWKWASDANTVQPIDLILDPVTQRVSLWRVLIAVAFAMGVWTMGQWVITGAVPADADKILYLYGTILGSLVAKVASGEWADVKANRQPVLAGFAAQQSAQTPGTPVATDPPAQPGQ